MIHISVYMKNDKEFNFDVRNNMYGKIDRNTRVYESLDGTVYTFNESSIACVLAKDWVIIHKVEKEVAAK